MVEIFKLLIAFFKGVIKALEYPLRIAEREVRTLEPRLGFGFLLRATFIALLIAASALGFAYLEVAIVKRIPGFRDFAQGRPWTILLALVFVPLIHFWRLSQEYRDGRKELEERLNEIKDAVQTVTEPLTNLANDPQRPATEFVRDALLACQDGSPLKDILKGLDPGNAEIIHRIVNKLDWATQVTNEKIEDLEPLLKLRPSVRNTLRNFLSKPFLNEDWGALYVTFAIQLQLQPWIGNHSARYVFVRDIDEFAFYNPTPELANIQFQKNLEKDLEAILRLVNGTLWSIMYRDVTVWDQDSYGESNKELRDRKDPKTDLRRLFVYKQDWLTDSQLFEALEKSAQWHRSNNYPCRYLPFDSCSRSLVQDNETFTSSCLINETVIMIHQIVVEKQLQNEQRPRKQLQKQKYQCDATQDVVDDYKQQFDHDWRSKQALDPEKFLEILTRAKQAAQLDETEGNSQDSPPPERASAARTD